MRNSNGGKWVRSVWAIAMVATALGAQAQPNPEDRPRRQPRPPAEAGAGDRLPMGGPGGRFMPGIERLQSVLTEEQRASLRESLGGQREKMRELEEKLRSARKEILEAGLVENFDETALRQKAGVAAKLDADLTVLRAKAMSQMRPRLTAEQLEKLKNAPMMGLGEAPRDRPGRAPGGPRDENDLPVKAK